MGAASLACSTQVGSPPPGERGCGTALPGACSMFPSPWSRHSLFRHRTRDGNLPGLAQQKKPMSHRRHDDSYSHHNNHRDHDRFDSYDHFRDWDHYRWQAQHCEPRYKHFDHHSSHSN
jgi:hypothetical protein